MPRLREQVDELDFSCFVSAVLEDAEVTGECGGVAGDVDYFCRFHLQGGF